MRKLIGGLVLLLLAVLAHAQVTQFGTQEFDCTPGSSTDGNVTQFGCSGSIYASATAVWSFNDPADLGNQDAGSCASCDLIPVAAPTAMGGALGYAAKFTSASSQYASVPDPAGGELDPGSGVSWGYAGWGIIHTAGSNKAIVSKALTVAASGEYDNFYVAAGGAHNCRFHDGTSTKLDGITPLPFVGSRFFYHCRYNATANELEAGFDATWSGSPTSTAGDGADQARAFTVAAHDGGGEAADLDLNSIVFYRSASGGEVLTDAMATSLYNSDKGKLCADMSGAELTNRVGCWDMTENGGPYVDSQGSNDLNGISTPTRDAGLVERSDSGMSVHGIAASTQRLTLADNADISTGDIDFSWVCWANPTDVSSVVLVDKNDEYQIGIDSGNDWYFKGGAGASDTATDTGVTVVAGIWHMVAGGYDGTNYWLRVDDGTRVNNVAGAPPSDTANGLAIMSTSAGASYWDGAADNCVFWKEDRTDAELDALYAGDFYTP